MPSKMFAKWVKSWAGIATLATACVSSIGVAFTIDERYAHAGTVQQGLQAVEKSQLRSERRYLRDKISDLEVNESRLTVHERKTLKTLRDDLRDVEDRIKELGR